MKMSKKMKEKIEKKVRVFEEEVELGARSYECKVS